MKTTFADTYYFLAIGNEQDEGHLRTARYAESFTGRIVTTEWVLTELPTRFLRLAGANFLMLLDLISDDDNWIVVKVSHELFVRGVELFSQRLDKSWSLTDCISFVVMRDHGLSEALTADHHFERAGFVSLLKRD